jgi:glycosyltransferase involved in cell wall biosynthesis
MIVENNRDILFITTNDIEKPVRGCDRRSYQLLENLRDQYQTKSISYNKSTDGRAVKTANENHVHIPYPSTSLFAPFHPQIFMNIFREHKDRDYDVVVGSGIGSFMYALVASKLLRTKLVVDIHNVEDQLSLAIGNYPRYAFAKIFGTLALNQADLVVVTSENDKREFSKRIQSKSLVVANGFDSNVFYPEDLERANRVLFFGNMNYEPNREAVELIATELASSLEKRCPNLEIHIAGPNSENVKNLTKHAENVSIVGLVDDIASYIRESSVVIVPLKTGSGTRLKIIESLACGTQVISTLKGAEGWPKDWENLTITKIDEFSAHIENIVKSPEFHSEETDEIMEYSWDNQTQRLADRINKL